MVNHSSLVSGNSLFKKGFMEQNWQIFRDRTLNGVPNGLLALNNFRSAIPCLHLHKRLCSVVIIV